MRPLTLNMQYFGPFINETIEFNHLSKSQLFLISGKTGSGKTMIFDAMVYALYGETSTQSRDKVDLRSHFADPKLPSKVQFEFKIKNESYLVVRTIKYIKEGNKNPTNSTVEVYKEVDGEWSLQTSTINESNQYLNDILHMNVKQFRQILILPQGEFKQFLISNSTEKRSILRTLFDSDRFEALQEQLGEEMKKEIALIESHYQQISQCLSDLHDFDHETLKELKDIEGHRYKKVENALVQYEEIGKEKLDYQLKELKEQETIVKNLEKKYEEKKVIKQNFDTLQEKQHELNMLNEQVEHINNLREQLRYLKTVQNITHQYNQLKEKQINKKETEKQHEELKTEKQEFHTQFEFYNNKLSEKLESQEDINKKRAFINKTNHIYTSIEQYYDSKEHLPEAKKQLEKLKEEITQKTNSITTLQESLKNIDADDEAEQNKLKQQESLKLELQQLENTQNQFQEKETLIATQKEIKSKLSELEQQKKNIEQSMKESDAFEVLTVEDEILKIQKHVHEGDACPICGSNIENLNGDIDFDSLRKEKEEQHEIKLKHQKISNDIAVYKERQNNTESQIKKLNDIESVSHKIQSVNDDLGKIQKEIEDLRDSRQRSQKMKQEIHDLEKGLSQDEINSISIQNEIKNYKHNMDYFNKETQFESIEDFSKQFKSFENEIKSYDQELETLQSRVNEYKEKLYQIENKLSSISERRQMLEEQVASIKSYLESEMDKQQIESYEQLDKLILSVNKIDEYEVEVTEFDKKYIKLEADVKELTEKVKDCDVPNLEDIISQLNAAKELEAEMTKSNTQLQLKVDQNKEKRDAIQKIIAKIERDLQEQEEMIELSRVMNGKNSEKLSLENYVLIYYLNHILDSANQQFVKMTNNRYQLVRKKEKSMGLSGLEIEVFDRFSNRTRHITSLSGGETFQASLSLAIGLSNIVQQEAGAVHLESMFIDEGFGTLDAETLETALDTLVNIQMSGRLVGIISHVSELKTRIPTILNVNKNGFLSTTSFTVN
ncbi:exonuclease subunit SbcC [Mammaliicoccus lentus]|uniref:SMC family ATPase n=1 Tax=Mammaliicoccus lentus TaxID=42858 RepID=A0ABS6GWS1_MAMLE|nr:exonuclease subunit SbcC [Mammaliicoccus lentus]MBU6112640.1 SMC family ATPase [Mammaliicoccus lentus]